MVNFLKRSVFSYLGKILHINSVLHFYFVLFSIQIIPRRPPLVRSDLSQLRRPQADAERRLSLERLDLLRPGLLHPQRALHVRPDTPQCEGGRPRAVQVRGQHQLPLSLFTHSYHPLNNILCIQRDPPVSTNTCKKASREPHNCNRNGALTHLATSLTWEDPDIFSNGGHKYVRTHTDTNNSGYSYFSK